MFQLERGGGADAPPHHGPGADLLVKMDIASMAHSLEVRSPFLDHRVVELPPHRRRSSCGGRPWKYLLKQVMKGVLPEPVGQRRKMGFGVPIDHCFCHELRDTAYDLFLGTGARGTSLAPHVPRPTLRDGAARPGVKKVHPLHPPTAVL